MKIHLYLPLLLLPPALALAGLEPLSNSQAFLAASLAALSTPKMKEAPVQVNAAITNATGIQEDYGTKAIVAIPDKSIGKLNPATAPETAQPLCRLWVKGCSLANDGKIISSTKAANLEVAAEGETHKVTVWLLALGKGADGNAELQICANQPEPVLRLPLATLKNQQPANADAPVDVSANDNELTLTILGTHEVKIGLLFPDQ